MCDPVTLALTATAVSGTIGAVGAYQQARTEKAVAGNNAILADRAAADATARGEKEAMQARRQGNLLIGSQRAGYASRGLDLAEGTPGEVIDQSDFFSQSDQATARTNGRKEAAGYTNQADMFRAKGDSINPGLQLAGSLLGTAGSVAGKWYSYNPTGNSFNGTNDFKGVNGSNAMDTFMKYGKGGD